MVSKNSDRAQPRRISIRERTSKVSKADFASMPDSFGWFDSFRKMIPDILAGRDLNELADSIVEAHRGGRCVAFMMGAHVVKCGLGGLIGELIRRGIVTAIAMNGACAIHDVEIALWGKTSEDVETALGEGTFGMTSETVTFFVDALSLAARDAIGMGEATLRTLAHCDPPNRHLSVLSAAYEAKVPTTIHVAIGTDTVHQHESIDGAKLGMATMKDFRLFCDIVSNLNNGVILNLGSAVIMPEVFLKALATARGRGISVGDFTAANFDMYSLYRPTKNIVERPRLLGAITYNFLSHHEIILPFLFAAIMAKLTN